MPKFGTVYFAGFFDHLHEGHLKALKFLKSLDCKKIVVLVGTDKQFAARKKAHHAFAEPQGTRIRNVRTALAKFGLLGKSIVGLLDEAISPDIVRNATPKDVVILQSGSNVLKRINSERKIIRMKPVKGIFLPRQAGISSTSIRRKIFVKKKIKGAKKPKIKKRIPIN